MRPCMLTYLQPIGVTILATLPRYAIKVRAARVIRQAIGVRLHLWVEVRNLNPHCLHSNTFWLSVF